VILEARSYFLQAATQGLAERWLPTLGEVDLYLTGSFTMRSWAVPLSSSDLPPPTYINALQTGCLTGRGPHILLGRQAPSKDPCTGVWICPLSLFRKSSFFSTAPISSPYPISLAIQIQQKPIYTKHIRRVNFLLK
jgi:hypothetical protein